MDQTSLPNEVNNNINQDVTPTTPAPKQEQDDDSSINIGVILVGIGILALISGGALGIFEALGFARYPVWVWALVLIAKYIFMGHWGICLIVGAILLVIGLILNAIIDKKQ